MNRLGRFLLRIGALGSLIAPTGAAAESVDVGLSNPLLAITTGFAGADVLLFGTVDGDGDIVVTVTGPLSPMVVRRKGQVNGVWINRQSLTFDNVPVFYAVAATRPLEVIMQPPVRQRERIGSQYLPVIPRANLPEQDILLFRQALIRNMERQALFQPGVGSVKYLAPRLFRTDLHMPANVPTGIYTVKVTLFRGGQVIASTSTSLHVSKIGASAEIYEFAQRQAFAYGFAAVLLAGLAGFGAYQLFQRR